MSGQKTYSSYMVWIMKHSMILSLMGILYHPRISWPTDFNFSSYRSFIKSPTWILHLASTSCSLVCANSSSISLSCFLRESFSSSDSIPWSSLLMAATFKAPSLLKMSLQCLQAIILPWNTQKITSIKLYFIAYIMSWDTVIRYFFRHCFWSSNESPFMKVFFLGYDQNGYNQHKTQLSKIGATFSSSVYRKSLEIGRVIAFSWMCSRNFILSLSLLDAKPMGYTLRALITSFNPRATIWLGTIIIPIYKWRSLKSTSKLAYGRQGRSLWVT